MAIIDTSPLICECGGKLVFLRESPNRVTGAFAPQDEVWKCSICNKHFVKTWRPDNIDYYTENADYDSRFSELRSDMRNCMFCNAFRDSDATVYQGQPACSRCFINFDWEEKFQKREVKSKTPSYQELEDFLEGQRAVQNGCWQAAIEKLQPFSTLGFRLADLHLGEVYDKGPSELRNPLKAAELYTKAARKGVAKAFYHLGKMFSLRDNENCNMIEAYKWLNLGAFFGDYTAADQREYIAREMTTEEILKAQELSSAELKSTFRQNDTRPHIIENLRKTRGELEGFYRYAEIFDGMIFQVFLNDFHEAEKIIRKLAADGFLPAMFNLALKLMQGKWLPKNMEEAGKWLVHAITRRYFPAMEFAWNETQKVPDLTIDHDWLKSSIMAEIDSGNPIALNFWGLNHLHGNGMPVNPEEAHKWLHLARFLGTPVPAADPLETLEKNLPFDQLTRYHKNARDWLDTHHGRVQLIRQMKSLFREKITAEKSKKWFKLGELFMTGGPGFLRHPVMAYGCFEFAARDGDQIAPLRLETLGRIVPAKFIETASRIVLGVEKSGIMP